MNRKSLGIYVHIPFCVQKCLYCDFVSAPASDQTKKIYMEQLQKEMEERAKQLCPAEVLFLNQSDYKDGKNIATSGEYIVDTVFIGGGTPSVLDAEWIKEILCKLKQNFFFADACECTIEVNPGTVDADKLKTYRKAGINRLSIGLQSCQDTELMALGRIHDYRDFLMTFRDARAAGFENINVDLMSAIPGQSVESFSATLEKVAALEPEHISVYSLIVEEGTPFYEMDLQLPTEEEERELYYKTESILKKHGYEQYEISNYARKGKECRHNIRYWQCREYIGFGVAAASYLNGMRWKNTCDIESYLKKESVFDEIEKLSGEDQWAEFMFMGLRMNQGISATDFLKRFGCSVDEIYGEVIEKHIQNGLLFRKDDFILLTKQGRDVCNYVMADFLL